MKRFSISHIVSSFGLVTIMMVALYSPQTRSSMSQHSREVVGKNAVRIFSVENQSSPISRDSWNHLKPAAQVTKQIIEAEIQESSSND